MPRLMRYPVLRLFSGLRIKSAMTWVSSVMPRLMLHPVLRPFAPSCRTRCGIADQVRNDVGFLGHAALDAASSLASVHSIADQVRNDVVSLGHAALDAVSSLASVHSITDQVRNDTLLPKKSRI